MLDKKASSGRGSRGRQLKSQALRVIQAQGEFRSKGPPNKSGERYDFRAVFRRFLVIHEFVLHGGAI